MFVRNSLLCFLLYTCLFLGNNALADPDPSLEYPVKAAFLYKFALYVEWPASAFESEDSPVAVGVLGSPGMVEQVEAAVRDRLLAGRPVTVSRAADQDLFRFHMLFVARSEQSRLARRSVPDELPVLVVTESPDWPGFGVINFVVADDRIRFDVDLESAGKRGLSLSAQLLNVARNIRGRP